MIIKDKETSQEKGAACIQTERKTYCFHVEGKQVLTPTSKGSTEVTEMKMGTERSSDSSYLWNYTEN